MEQLRNHQQSEDAEGEHAYRVLETLLGWQDEDWHWHFEQFPELAERVRAQLPPQAGAARGGES
ncbi:hypothetical protein HX137_31925 [Pseudomonas sp. 165]|uniref:hypothetical protein n=1 Tax=Pseudomonas sp. 165 TaxID=2746722 RepID=UPI0025777203|nr:hypothetical protein [Pseudomonas sp. 165]MDM1715218.1 hypothetical protein [Pseudomonas sp. 165]